ncbi:unnamed protein product [Lasius platythorax]|uniref:Uncharacterized protein n=1 Tax=Lasius platythorax TaxID=488582 RepID=A0AAV2P0A7_9HYME
MQTAQDCANGIVKQRSRTQVRKDRGNGSRSKELFTLGQYLCGDVRIHRHINMPASMKRHGFTSQYEATARGQSENRSVVS